MIHPITKYGQPVLEQQAEAITEFDTPELHKLVDDMFESMYAARKRIVVIDITTGEDPAQKIVMINPEIVAREGSQTGEEGCLSIPTFREPVTRAQKVTVRAKDATGKEFEMTGEDLLARAMQHETDHLNGMLYISHVSPLKRDLIRRKIRKLQKIGEWG
jgi:peptide deformylase